MQHQPKHPKWIFFFVILLVALSMAMPVLADYLGPNRTVTTTVSVCKVVLYECQLIDGKYKDHRVDNWSCSSESKPWEAYPSHASCHAGGDVGNKHWEREDKTETVTTTYPAATISGSIQNCTVQNGWCVTSPTLSLSANEPLAGYSILLIEGTLNGGTFACPNGATSCTVPFNEGENNFNYWALSSWGDSSQMGTSVARVDTVAPSVGLDISGVSGANGWYVSPLTITATGADATSGVASTLLSIDGGATWQPALILNEGVYNAVVTVADNAGNVSSSSATLSVDTTTPAITMSVAGTLGKNGWYKSAIQVSALASDATSGVATFEVSADGAAYQSYTPISFNDGPHTIQFRAVDAAGNVTETAPQTFYVDTLAPTVNLPASWQLGTNVPYEVIDEGSGLAALRIVIEDEDEKYAKVAWDQEVSGSMYSQDIDWNGEFKDKTVAPPGTYLVWLKASDLAGNERFQLGKVIVPETNLFLSLLPTEAPAVSAATPEPPAELSEPETVLPVTAPPAVDFGGGTTQPGEATKQSLLLATGSAGAASTTTSGVLWGAAAAAAISAATAYALEADRKRKEAEEAQGKAERAEKHLSKSEKAERAREHDEKVKERKERQSWANPAKEKELLRQQKERDQAYQELLQQQAQAQAAANAHMEEKMTKFEKQEETAWVAAQAAIKAKQEEKKKAEEAAAKQAAMLASLPGFNSEKQSQASVVTAPQEKSWWEKTFDFVDQHQTEFAIGIGVTAGVLAIVLTAGMATPFVVAAGGAMLAAGGIVAAGTVALNAHYERPLTQNLLKNVTIAAGTALVTTSVMTFLTKGIFALGNSVLAVCARTPTACARAEVVMNALDKVEEVGLLVKGTFQSWRGDSIGAAETALELQMEYLDGGMPGNSVAKELGGEAIEKAAQYGDEAIDLVKLYGSDAAQIIFAYGDDGIAILQKHGNDAIPLLLKYGGDAVDIIGAYGDDGIKLLAAHGDEGIKLVKDYGTPAVQLMKAVDTKAADKLLTTLDGDVVDYAIQQGPDAVAALSRWGADDLSEHGIELALRAQKDAKVLADVKKLAALGPIDLKHLTDEQQALIDAIAANSRQNIDGGQVVIGSSIDLGSGYAGYAEDTGSIFYNTHPDMWPALGGLGDKTRSEVGWLINKQALQPMVDAGMPFEYTLNGIKPDDVDKEIKAIGAIWAGATDADILKALGAPPDRIDLPGRMKELVELYNAGYIYSYDAATNSYVLIKP